MLRVGLTGGLACGKTTVLRWLGQASLATIDLDELARQVLAPGSPLLAPVRERFGDQVFAADGTLDRARLAARVFAEPAERQALERIVHPEVARLEDARSLKLEAAGATIVVSDVPLLFEAGLAARYQRIVCVACRPETQLARAVARGMTAAEAAARIAAQWPIAAKVARADYVISTDCATEETRRLVSRLVELLRADARAAAAGEPLSATSS